MKTSMGLYGLQDWFGGALGGVLDLCRVADDKGVDAVGITDHVIMSENTDKYPYGPFPSPPAYPWYEPMVVLSGVAAVTRRIRLATGILISPLRPAVLLAKQLATLDVLSEGRVEIGLGVGWQREEYDSAGIPWEGRFGAMIEQVRVCKALWAEEAASFHGAHVGFDRLYSRPAPVQGKDMPFWFGLAPSDRNFERIAEVGDGWIPMETDPAKLGPLIGKLKTAFVAAGRDPATLQVRTVARPIFTEQGPDLKATLAQFPAYAEAGVTMLEVMPFIFCRGPDDLPVFLDAVLAAAQG